MLVTMSIKVPRELQLRERLIQEAARLMIEEGVSQYFTAKRLASKRLLGRGGQKSMRFHPHDLPSNGEIREAILRHIEIMDGGTHQDRLFAMRVIAWETMGHLQAFQPALIGSVSTGHVRRGSDIDLHVFPDHPDLLETHLEALGWEYEIAEVTIRKGGQLRDFLHIHLERIFPVELSIYEPCERRISQRSSTDGKPIIRVSQDDLWVLLQTEHAEAWAAYQASGEIEGLERFAREERVRTLATAEEEDEEPMA